ncbi:MAG: gephyrin-like molybdotransferase Glp [Pirellulaceae bacterium]
MRGFSQRSTVRAALEWLDGQLTTLDQEMAPLAQAAGRVLAADVVASVNVPRFRRSMMDGFAVRAADTLGASPYNRLPLSVCGEMLPGRTTHLTVHNGEAIRIMTGAPLPDGADAVLPAEHVEDEGERIYVLGEVAPAKHVGHPGEDIAEGTTVLRAGRRLRPQDVGLLSSIGVSQVAVVRAPCVRIVVTGDELLPPGSTPRGFQIADSNSPMLASLIRRDGGEVLNSGIVPDKPEVILEAFRKDADVILVSGGSSVGQEDYAPVLIARHGELAIHGIAMRPSSPTGMGRLENRLVFLLPGNPVSCFCAYDMFAGRAIRALGGREKAWPYRTIRLPLQRKLVSVVGRLDYARVRVLENGVEPLAIGGASVLSSTTRADGFVLIPDDSEGYAEGTVVEVFLYDA